MTKKEILFDFFGIAAQKTVKIIGFPLFMKFILAVHKKANEKRSSS